MSHLFVVTTQMLNFCGRATKISAHYATASLSDSLAFIVLHITKRFIIALLALPAEDAEQGLCGLRRASVRLSVHSSAARRCCGFAAVGPAGRRYRSIAAAAGRRSSTAHSSIACGGRMRAVPRCQRT